MNEDYIERQWCEFETVYGYGTTSGAHHVCRRCGNVWRWSGYATDPKLGPCRIPAPRAVYDGALT